LRTNNVHATEALQIPKRSTCPPYNQPLQSEDGGHTHGNDTVASELASSSVLGLLSDTGAGRRHGAAHGAGSAHHAAHHRAGGGSARRRHGGGDIGEGYTGGGAEGGDSGGEAYVMLDTNIA
jgi:hypothetical protein